MDCSFETLTKIFNWRSPDDEVKVQWSKLHISIVREYFKNISKACDFEELPSADMFDRIFGYAPRGCSTILIPAEVATSFAQVTRRVFMVPRVNKIHQSQHPGIKKYQLVEAFLSFLLRLLYEKTGLMINSYEDRIDNLEKELRFLLTILGHTSLVLCDDEHASEQVWNLLEEFAAVANEAGSLVHSLLFSIDQVSKEMEKGLAVVLNHVDLLNDSIMEFLNLVSSNSRQAFIIPKASVVDSLLFVDSLIYYLEDLKEREDNRIADVKDQVKFLHEGLMVWKSSIKNIGSPQPSEIGELKEHLMRIGDMAREAEYLIISFSVGDAPCWYLINRLTKIGHMIKVIGSELQNKNKSGDLKDEKYLGTRRSLQEKKNTEVDDFTVGFEDKIRHILDQLEGRKTEPFLVISIFGMPGIGKTTLAKKLYNHRLVNCHFDRKAWCVVSQQYDRRSVLTDIWNHLTNESGKNSYSKMEEESLVELIYKTLKGRRYLIVLDDIWDLNVWYDLRRYFPNDGNGSRILFTTRNKDVAPPNCSNYALPSLSNDQCWELLEKKVFGNKACPRELIGIGQKIAANCWGLPLAVVVIAGILSTMDKEKNAWEKVRGNLASHVFDGGDNSVMQILELSYKHLPKHLKPCFLYFGAFWESKEIPVGKLMRLWISEGFIHKEEGKSAENVAEEYLMELIDKSLVMIGKVRSDGGVKACVLHALLRDLCLKKSEEENFLRFVNSDCFLTYERGHRIQAPRHHVVSTISCQHTRSFHGLITPPFYVRDMRLLRVLNCDSLYTINFSGMEYLVNLRYLVISNVPPSVDRLVNLEYLRLAAFNVVSLPPEIVNMRKLRYIQTPIGMKYNKNCNSSETSNLEFLSCVWITELKDEEMLKCSPHLRKLKCRPFSSQDKGEKRFVNLSFLTQLESLKIGPSKVHVNEISFPSNIKKLTLFRCPMDIFNINSEMMSIIGRLEKLEVLKLKSISFEDKRWETRDGEFETLKFLKLSDIRDLDQWNVDSSEHFPRLQQLVLKDCKNLERIPSEIGEIATLEMIEVQGICHTSVVTSAKRIQQQQQEDLGDEALRVIISVQSWIPNAHGSSSSGRNSS